MITSNLNNTRILCGDFNAYSPAWGSVNSNTKGNRLSQAMEEVNYVPINDKLSTYIPRMGKVANNLDLVIVPANRACQFKYQLHEDSSQSDHIPVIVDYNSKHGEVKSNSTRMNIQNVDWVQVNEKIERRIREIKDLNEETPPNLVMERFTRYLNDTLLESGAYKPSEIVGKRKSQPL